MTGTDEAKPRRTRNRRSTYATRREVRLTEEHLAVVEQAIAAAAARGRRVTLSSILRAALVDGCQSMISAMERGSSSPAGDAVLAAAAADGLADELRLLRTDLRRLGNNVNQLTHIAHQTGRLSADLTAVRVAIDQLDARLVSATGQVLGFDGQAE